jgi:glycosyltransferase involved in cell wall biosynthesis
MAQEKYLTALPVYNEVKYVDGVLDEVRRYSEHVLVVDDGSSDGTADLLAARNDIRVVTHGENRGYGAALRTAFQYAVENEFQILVTIDCDGQHEPQRIPSFVEACRDADLVSGSRYLKQYAGDSRPPAQRRWINRLVTSELNRRLGLTLTDAFCGFKAYRVEALRQLQVDENGYSMPLEVWVHAACSGWKIVEMPVPLIYLEEKRSFGGALDDGDIRLQYYHLTLDRSISRRQRTKHASPAGSQTVENAG